MKPEELIKGALYETRLGVLIEYQGGGNPVTGWPFATPCDGVSPAIAKLELEQLEKLHAHKAPRIGACLHCRGRIPEPELITIRFGKRNDHMRTNVSLCRFCVADIVGELAQQLRH